MNNILIPLFYKNTDYLIPIYIILIIGLAQILAQIDVPNFLRQTNRSVHNTEVILVPKEIESNIHFWEHLSIT